MYKPCIRRTLNKAPKGLMPNAGVERQCLYIINIYDLNIGNPLPNRNEILHVCCRRLKKSLLVKEKLLKLSNFFFTNNGFYPTRAISLNIICILNVICKLFQIGTIQNLSFGNGLKEKIHGYPPIYCKIVLPIEYL